MRLQTFTTGIILGASALGLALPSGAAAELIFQDGFEQIGCAPAPTASLTVNVRDHGAVGDGVSDDTDAIQAAIDAVAGTGGTVTVPAGVYSVDVRRNGWMGALMVGSQMTLRLDPDAVLRAQPTASDTYSILSAIGRSDVNIIGGSLVGERYEHLGNAGEYGFGIDVRKSHRVAIQDVTVSKFWGDGVYIGYPWDDEPRTNEDIRICGLVATDNRRQGLSITAGRRIHITDSTFSHTRGTNPQRGIDIEPDGEELVEDVRIEYSSFIANTGGGFQAGVPWVADATIRDVVFANNYIADNGPLPGDPPSADARMGTGVYLANVDGVQILDNTIVNTLGRGILLVDDATNTHVEGNWVEATRAGPNPGETGNGIEIGAASGSTIVGNTVVYNDGWGIHLIWPDSTVTIEDNTEYGNGRP